MGDITIKTVSIYFLIIASFNSFNLNAGWLKSTYNNYDWYYTREKTDLDQDVSNGAKILKYDDGSYVQAVHGQWGGACRHNCVATILRKMGFSNPNVQLLLPADVDYPPGSSEPKVDLRYPGSEEHLMYLWTRRQRISLRYEDWYLKYVSEQFISSDGVLNNTPYDNWLKNYSPGDWGQGQTNFMNYVLHNDLGFGAFDARQWGPSETNPSDLVSFRRIIKGFIDNDIPMLVMVKNGGHFNVIIGYRGSIENTKAPFYVYTSETTRSFWRRIEASVDNIWRAGMMNTIFFWNHHLNGGCEPGGWAFEVDSLNDNALLCGYTISPDDQLILPDGIVNVSSVNSSSGDGRLSTTSDGLYAVFSSSRPGTSGGSDIFEARRETASSGWVQIEAIEEISSPSSEWEACVRGDGLEICFASKRAGGSGGVDIWRSVRNTRLEKWSEPEPISAINSKWNESGPCFSGDGLRLYFHSWRSGSGDIYFAERSSLAEPFGLLVCVMSLKTSYGEFVPCVCPDDKTIYFASNRPGGEGGMDIWKATRSNRDSDWSELTNLSVINTTYREFSPWYEAATGLLYFEADRQVGFGGKDVYAWDKNYIRGDINKDLKVDMKDVALLSRDWMLSSPESNVIGNEDIIDIYDLNSLIYNWLNASN